MICSCIIISSSWHQNDKLSLARTRESTLKISERKLTVVVVSGWGSSHSELNPDSLHVFFLHVLTVSQR